MRRISLLLASVMLAVLLVSGIAGAQTEGAVLDAHAELVPGAGGTDTGLHDPLIQTFVAEHTGFVTEVTALIAVGPPGYINNRADCQSARFAPRTARNFGRDANYSSRAIYLEKRCEAL